MFSNTIPSIWRPQTQDTTAHPDGPGRSAGTANNLQTQNIALAPRQEITLPQTRNRGAERPRIAINSQQRERPKAELRPRIGGLPLRTADALGKTASIKSYEKIREVLDDHHLSLLCADNHDDAQAAVKRLEDLRRRATDYVNEPGNSGTDEIRNLVQEIANEKLVLGRLRDELENGHAIPSHMSFADVVGFVREGVSLRDIGVAERLNLTPAEARALITDGQFDGLWPGKVGFLKEYMKRIDKQILTPEARKKDADLEFLQRCGFNGREAKLLVDAGLGVWEGQLYRAVRLPITADTIVGGMRDSNLTAPPKEAGSGGFNTVYFVEYDTPNGPYTGVFKPLPPVTGEVIEAGVTSYLIGIDSKNPQNAMRNLATYDVARQLGFNVVPHTEIGIHALPQPQPPDKTPLGIVMTHAMGKPAGEIRPDVFDLPEVRRELIKLQLLDALTGQGDRHQLNYFIHIDGLKATVTGIDNEQSFGKNTHLPDDVAYADQEGKDGFWGVNLPPVADTEMVAAFDKITPESLEATLTGKLTPEEIAAAKDRLLAIKAHLSELKKRNAVIEPDQWLDTDTYFSSSHDNYAVRDQQAIKYKLVRPLPRV